MRKEPKVNPMWFVLLVMFIIGGGTVYVMTSDISAVIDFAVGVVVFAVVVTAFLYGIALISAIVLLGGVFLWRCYRRRVPAS